jgi:deazaflavin-dependent oxidoreductase (nitroreductase family)
VRSDIAFEPARPNILQRAVQRFGRTTLGTAVLSRLLRPLDLLVHQLSRGRTTFAGLFGGFPIVMLTTIGARSGLPRTNPLTGIPHGDDLAVLGANYGLGVLPSWVYNLRANHDAELTYRDRTTQVVAREVVGDDAEEVFAAACGIYPGYADYRERFAEPIPVFVIEARR